VTAPDERDIEPVDATEGVAEHDRFNRGGVVPPEPPGGRTGNVRVEAEGESGETIAFQFLVGNGANAPDQLAKRASDLAEQIIDWWTRVSEQDALAATAKSTEYGGSGAAIDLVWLGQQLVEMGQAAAEGTADWTARDVPTQQATELGIFFYLLGKIGRWKAAILEGRPVSDDTIKDIHTYAMMARYNREHGSWP
jgi:hypothetical protein